MLTVTQARERILAALTPTPAETIPLAAAHNRVLASPVIARLTQPPADVSAMDGFALRAQDAPADATLTIIGTAPAGHPFPGIIGPSQAIHIFTGSIIPAGADSVLIQEDSSTTGTTLTVSESCVPGKNIRKAGQDFAAGETLLEPGQRLTPGKIGLVAAANHPWLAVHRKPRIAILATGDEIALPGEPIPEGGIISSNAHALAAFVSACGGDPIILPIARDTIDAITAGTKAAAGADLLVTTGGASVGAHDLVQDSLKSQGLALDFWKIAMRPGKPLMFGGLGQLPVLGLPGNPVSALVCALLFLRPAIERLSGLPGAAPATTTATLTAALKPNDHREDFLRATITHTAAGDHVTPFPVQDSGMLKTFAHATALINRPPHDPAQDSGATVQVILL